MAVCWTTVVRFQAGPYILLFTTAAVFLGLIQLLNQWSLFPRAYNKMTVPDFRGLEEIRDVPN
jgi:hypothetical protein